jgi:hypothetical protein
MTVHSVVVHEILLLIPEKDEWLTVKKKSRNVKLREESKK